MSLSPATPPPPATQPGNRLYSRARVYSCYYIFIAFLFSHFAAAAYFPAEQPGRRPRAPRLSRRLPPVGITRNRHRPSWVLRFFSVHTFTPVPFFPAAARLRTQGNPPRHLQLSFSIIRPGRARVCVCVCGEASALERDLQGRAPGRCLMSRCHNLFYSALNDLAHARANVRACARVCAFLLHFLPSSPWFSHTPPPPLSLLLLLFLSSSLLTSLSSTSPSLLLSSCHHYAPAILRSPPTTTTRPNEIASLTRKHNRILSCVFLLSLPASPDTPADEDR